MRLEIVAYRFRRLWRVMLLGCLGPMAVVLYAAVATHQLSPVLLGLAVLLPIATVLRYTIQWQDTFTMSLALSACLALHFWLGTDLVAMEQFFRFLWLSALGIALFLVLITPVCRLIFWGPMLRFTPVAKGRSTLDIKTLRGAITFYPGRASGRYKCGEANENGQFAVSIVVAQIDQLRFEEKKKATQANPEVEAVAVDVHGRIMHEGFARVLSSGPNHHEVLTYSEDDKGQAQEYAVVIRHDFTDVSDGHTEVRQTEYETELPFGASFGFWLTDFMSDGLTEQIDRAEGRDARANRCFALHSLSVDLANILVPLMGGKRIEHSEAQ